MNDEFSWKAEKSERESEKHLLRECLTPFEFAGMTNQQSNLWRHSTPAYEVEFHEILSGMYVRRLMVKSQLDLAPDMLLIKPIHGFDLMHGEPHENISLI